ncbi:hypothetical protein XELAEV_18045946mg [Xenopus laevis]|uniref:Uncharacterized protein n=1 Tax=Xenopus laevis TaxID=8355 RepID=A0A974H069_XENLA|nr:hypothetical protein XELAEV_18045946mg [Xenopus laevis]
MFGPVGLGSDVAPMELSLLRPLVPVVYGYIRGGSAAPLRNVLSFGKDHVMSTSFYSSLCFGYCQSLVLPKEISALSYYISALANPLVPLSKLLQLPAGTRCLWTILGGVVQQQPATDLSIFPSAWI